MKENATGPSMNQKIFSMNFDVETISLYLLCCAVADTGQKITRSMIQDRWNGDLSILEKELDRLGKKNIVCRVVSEPEDDPVYRLVDEKNWR